MEVKKQNAHRKEDQNKMEFHVLKSSSILCPSIRSLAHETSFYLQTGNHVIVYCHRIYRLFVDYLGLLRRLSTRPVTNGPWLLPQRSMVYGLWSILPRVYLRWSLSNRIPVQVGSQLWSYAWKLYASNLRQINRYTKVPQVIPSLSRFSFRKLFRD
jgi:hypothetical protein